MNKSQLLVIDGGAVKTGSEGVVQGLGIVFGSEKEPDQSRDRDFFTQDSFIMKKKSFTVPLYHEHGLGIIKDQIGEATLTKTDAGWEAVAELDLEDDAAKQVYENVQKTQYGFSTGAMQHLVEREAKSNGTNFLKKWVVGELSLTARPAERKAIVQAVKSLDGEIVHEPVWEEVQQKSEFIITAFSEGDEKVWDSAESDLKSLEEPAKPIKKIEIKSTSGSVQYQIYNYDEDSGIGREIQVYEWGGVSDFIARIREAVDVAEAAIKSSTEPDEVDFESRVAAIVEKVVKRDQEGVSELKQKLQEQEQELADLKTQLADSENNLANEQERSARLEILAGAAETIIKHKGK